MRTLTTSLGNLANAINQLAAVIEARNNNNGSQGIQTIEEPLLRRDKAAEYIRNTYGIPCGTSTLASYASQPERVVGGGPLFRKAGNIPLYAKTDLDLWASKRMRIR